MRPVWPLLLLPALLGQAPAAKDEEPAPPLDKVKRERLLKLYREEAAGYTIYRDSRRKEKVELRAEPVYVWTNQVRSKGQDGAVFVWTCRGRAEVIGTFFSYPRVGPRSLNHELHSLATTVLDVTREGEHTWTPQVAGVEFKPIEGAPKPAGTATGRLVQMRALVRDFTAQTQDFQDRKWDLRPLPQPLYREESTDPDVLDGAVFAYVASSGTDPEVILVFEARRPAGGNPSWHYALARFTDLDLVVKHKGTEVMKVARIPWDAPEQDLKQRYRTYRDRGIPAVEEEQP